MISTTELILLAVIYLVGIFVSYAIFKFYDIVYDRIHYQYNSSRNEGLIVLSFIWFISIPWAIIEIPAKALFNAIDKIVTEKAEQYKQLSKDKVKL